MTPVKFGILSNVSPKQVNRKAKDLKFGTRMHMNNFGKMDKWKSRDPLVHTCTWTITPKCTNRKPEKGRGLGYVTLIKFGTPNYCCCLKSQHNVWYRKYPAQLYKIARTRLCWENGKATTALTAALKKKQESTLCYRKDDRAMRPVHGCPENFRDSLTTPTANIPNIFSGLLFRSSPWMFLQNLKSVALPVPEIIGVPKNGQSLDMPTLHFLQNF